MLISDNRSTLWSIPATPEAVAIAVMMMIKKIIAPDQSPRLSRLPNCRSSLARSPWLTVPGG